MKNHMTLSEELQWRGFVNQSTFSDLKDLDKKEWTFYHGFDASAPSQTVGNLAALMFDKVFMRHGHKAVILAGGATSLIGDPGGKDSERPLQDEKTIGRNVAYAEEQLKRILKGHDFTLVNNLDWTKGMTVIDFLRDIGKHFSMTPLVQRDYIATRIGEGGAGISYTEFSYTLLQGMDYLHLYDAHGVTLQLGGSDQWGNCLSGVELVRKARGAEVHVITLPLVINKATGKKFGKSENGAVWLDAKLTSPTQFYQFWINIDDEGLEGYLKIFTELGKTEVDDIMTKHREDPKGRFAQTRLAQEVTRIVHGEEEMETAEAVTQILTGKKSLAEASDKVLESMRRELPHTTAQAGDTILEVLTTAGLVESKSEARRLLQGNAISINGQRIAREELADDDFKNGRLLIRKGKAFRDSALVEQA
ncbi:MAG TPA: tyrosine--tRNA ligase [Candidatus Saccharimonadales bacterium]|nr:tyrosine--tRNA ligase [Candidatus Saccharimonadales bacterium]